MPVTVSATETKFSDLTRMPDARGHFGPYGGRFVSETLSFALEELEQIYLSLRDDPDFQAEFDRDLAYYVGRPSPLY
ncbi:MAG: tryptophan synthase subunit beta, partial [Pseudomonadota bacterium]|nr:tryptophan synthase subunit beta [Pseudomonadota bacterium]